MLTRSIESLRLCTLLDLFNPSFYYFFFWIFFTKRKKIKLFFYYLCIKKTNNKFLFFAFLCSANVTLDFSCLHPSIGFIIMKVLWTALSQLIPFDSNHINNVRFFLWLLFLHCNVSIESCLWNAPHSVRSLPTLIYLLLLLLFSLRFRFLKNYYYYHFFSTPLIFSFFRVFVGQLPAQNRWDQQPKFEIIGCKKLTKYSSWN